MIVPLQYVVYTIHFKRKAAGSGEIPSQSLPGSQ